MLQLFKGEFILSISLLLGILIHNDASFRVWIEHYKTIAQYNELRVQEFPQNCCAIVKQHEKKLN